MKTWQLKYYNLLEPQQRLRETLCTLGNGYFATRGAWEEAHDDGVHYPGTYIAGCYNRVESQIANRTIVNEDLVNCPNWLPITWRVVGGEWINLTDSSLEEYEQTLDLLQGTLKRQLWFVDKENRKTKIISRRIVSMHNPHIAAIEYTLIPLN
ncbi:hypothetical protein AYO29_04375 [Coxiella burnetii str. Schperling]|nr:hypothetical protein AYO29_04375 [Coxiella burnetii str. Schperling]PHH58116.1 hypothetical protein CRH12_01245 [Coxiella burnetii]